MNESQPEGTESKVKVVLADDHAIVRDGIRMILESEPDIEVVAEVGDAESAKDSMTRSSPVWKRRPATGCASDRSSIEFKAMQAE